MYFHGVMEEARPFEVRKPEFQGSENILDRREKNARAGGQDSGLRNAVFWRCHGH